MCKLLSGVEKSDELDPKPMGGGGCVWGWGEDAPWVQSGCRRCRDAVLARARALAGASVSSQSQSSQDEESTRVDLGARLRGVRLTTRGEVRPVVR